MLVMVWDAQFFISGFPLQFNSLHQRYSSVTGFFAVLVSHGAAVDVPARMDAGFADG
jgi:hypothetical protein